ncbi:hypothetical protein AB1Y20_011854 [Prymnesium parvum]|uniref:Uncharacterized protein n=1 Tax=Prymnesium parvum TaxID=97485 RepID=A0AB34IJB5_PRYPA
MAAMAALLASLAFPAFPAFPATAGRPVTVLVERELAAPLSAARHGLLHFHWARAGVWPPRILPLAPASRLSSSRPSSSRLSSSPSSPSSSYPAACSSPYPAASSPASSSRLSSSRPSSSRLSSSRLSSSRLSSSPSSPSSSYPAAFSSPYPAASSPASRRVAPLLMNEEFLRPFSSSPSPPPSSPSPHPPSPSYLDEPPLVYTRLTRLHSPSGVRAAVRAWLSFTFRRGGGLPLPPPLPLPHGARLVVPPFLLERLLAVDEERGALSYAVSNPSLLTYQVHSHRGEVRFAAARGGGVEMAWRVEVRPYRGWEPAVTRFTAAVVDALARNLQAHLAAPGATVRLPPPLAAWRVERASWAGGVAEAWREDRRPLARRAAELWRPWRWGRRDAPGEAGEWTRGEGQA